MRYLHPFIFHHLSRLGGGSSLSREAQNPSHQALYPAFQERSQGVSRQAQRHSLSSMSWVFPGASYRALNTSPRRHAN